MNIYSDKFINLISILITIIFFLIISFFINKSLNINFQNGFSEEIISEENKIQEKRNDKILKEDNEKEEYNWYIKIPSIDLYAPIEETTKMEILNRAIGHFEDTSSNIGNIGLAGHNRGYDKNYFENLKNVKKGDEVLYKYGEFAKTYIVDTIEVIRNTDWSYLENTKNNKITMITCVEGNSDLRLCVQGSEKE